jgi:alpha-galactosidase
VCLRSRFRPQFTPAPSHVAPSRLRSDCWEEKQPPRDPATGELRADTKRFPSGMKALGDYVHSKGLSFAIYSAESTETCGGYPASLGKEALDAA